MSEENFRRNKGGWGVFSEIDLRKKIVLGLSLEYIYIIFKCVIQGMQFNQI
jgi:hypothetical protein